MDIQIDLTLIAGQLANFWPLIASIAGIVVGVILLRFFRRTVRAAISWMRERFEGSV